MKITFLDTNPAAPALRTGDITAPRHFQSMAPQPQRDAGNSGAPKFKVPVAQRSWKTGQRIRFYTMLEAPSSLMTFSALTAVDAHGEVSVVPVHWAEPCEASISESSATPLFDDDATPAGLTVAVEGGIEHSTGLRHVTHLGLNLVADVLWGPGCQLSVDPCLLGLLQLRAPVMPR